MYRRSASRPNRQTQPLGPVTIACTDDRRLGLIELARLFHEILRAIFRCVIGPVHQAFGLLLSFPSPSLKMQGDELRQRQSVEGDVWSGMGWRSCGVENEIVEGIDPLSVPEGKFSGKS